MLEFYINNNNNFKSNFASTCGNSETETSTLSIKCGNGNHQTYYEKLSIKFGTIESY